MATVLEQCKGTIKDGLCMKCFNRAMSSSSVCIQMYEIEVPVPPKESIPVCHCAKCDPLANGLPPNIFQSKSGEPGNEVKKEEFDGSVQFELDFGDRFIRVNCPDEDNDIHLLIKRNSRYCGISLDLDQAEQLANYILGHVKNARLANPD